MAACSSFAQKHKKVVAYNYGKNGIEYIAKSKSGKTFVVSTFNSRPLIKDEVAAKVFDYFREKLPKDGDKITIITKKALVKGTCHFKVKEDLTSIEFYYETVEWKSGVTEAYTKPATTTISIADNDDKNFKFYL